MKKIAGEHRIFNLKHSRAIQQDWGYQGQRLPAFPNEIKETVDWRPHNWAPCNQGRTGTCVGNALSGLLQCQTGKILSRMQIWGNAVMNDPWDETVPGALGDGTSLKTSLDCMRKTGAVLEKDWPFFPYNSWYMGTGFELRTESAKYRIDSYYNLGTDQDLWKLWLSNYGPVYMALNVDLSYVTVNNTGILNPYKFSSNYGGHAIYCCGYIFIGGIFHFIFPGSWGSQFGKSGVVFANADYASHILEAYGVITK